MLLKLIETPNLSVVWRAAKIGDFFMIRLKEEYLLILTRKDDDYIPFRRSGDYLIIDWRDNIKIKVRCKG